MAIRANLEMMPVYTPWVTYLIILIQAVSISLLCALSGIVKPHLTHQRIVVKGIMTWSGIKTIEHFIEPNIWAGPSIEKLIMSGALYGVCLREDKELLLRRAMYAAKPSELGCCEAIGRGAGTLTQDECNEYKALFHITDIRWVNVTCSKRTQSITSGYYVPHEFKPCCLPGAGQCLLVNHKHCVILGGIWHIAMYEHCSQALCDSDICQVYEHNEHDEVTHSSAQFWRLPLSLVYHHGIVQVILFSILQAFIALDIERILGWLYFLSVYLICGLGGLLFGTMMIPHFPNTGCGGAIAGLLALQIIEFFHCWPLIESKWKGMAKLTLLTFMVFGLGMLPGINQFTNMFGFFMGFLCYFIFMPYIIYSKIHEKIMVFLQILAIIIVIAVLSLIVYLFYITQPKLPPAARFLNCLAFIAYSCDLDLP